MPTGIEYVDETWNPVTGCTKISAGCKNCYAERMAKRLAGRFGYPADEPFRVTLHPDRLDQPLHWKNPRRIFVNSMSDAFHEDIDFAFIDHIFAVAAVCSQHTLLILTKRERRMLEYIEDRDVESVLTGVQQDGRSERAWSQNWLLNHAWMKLASEKPLPPWPLPNVWLGVTVENQAAADECLPLLLQCPAAVRFVSVEPMLGSVDLRPYIGGDDGDGDCVRCGCEWTPEIDSHECPPGFGPRPDWVICGRETGPGARPMELDWARSLRDQCAAAGVPFFLKRPETLDGRVHHEWPEGAKR